MTTPYTGLLDTILPCYRFVETHHISIRATPARIMACIRAYRTRHDLLVRIAIGMRELPARLLGYRAGRMLDLDDFGILGQDGDTEIVFGLMGAFWKPDYGLVPIASPHAFTSCRRTGLCRLAMGFRITADQDTGHATVMTQTRVDCPDATSYRRFAPYWYAIRPVSGLIRHRMLGQIRAMATSDS
ncbi:hypothetical protein CFR73_07875 [Novacetimonas maltaceti]|uniref:DUF2867 domain-containing protein n=1 Tax=Novacetimonas maltaceti TaxID=1203393 RepID=A0A2S3W4Z7_9PROT|nr:hypothetical protein [Novacetimonas maltaceti]POF63907.1 hypothetical protein KMAL_04400 [Novacetimonas maltaceti]PYD60310.1 hypothetical protein CFR73_07875 [Novacetimonas maltaceti]